MVGLFASETLGGIGLDVSIGSQVRVQFIGAATTAVYSGIVTYVILKVLDGTMGLRVSPGEESQGLDISLHNESGFNL